MFTVGLAVICTISGVVKLGNIPFIVKTTAACKVRSVSEYNLLVNCSKYVKEHTKLTGNFTKVLVQKTDCVIDN